MSSRYSGINGRFRRRCVLPLRLQQTPHARQINRMTRIQRCFQAGGSSASTAITLICGISCLISTARPQPDHRRRLAQIRGRDGRLLEQFQRQRALPGNHHRMVDGGTQVNPCCCDSSIAFAFACQSSRHEAALRRQSRAPHQLDIGGGGWHDDQRLHA